MSGVLLSANVTSIIHEGDWTGSVGRTGIDKRAVATIEIAREGVIGDHVLDTKAHGGTEKAVYSYAIEDLRWWEAEVEHALSSGSFGENLTTSGIDVTGAVIGEQWQIGSTILEVSQPRIPCRVFAGFWKRPTLVKDFTDAGKPGAYLRVIAGGPVSAGDKIEIVRRPDHAFTIGEAFRAKSGGRDLVPRILDVPDLPASWHAWAHRILSAE